MKRAATAKLMRELNRSAVLDMLRMEGPLARAELARRLGISAPTVMRVVDELLTERLVRETGESEASGGRPRTLLEFNTSSYAVIGLDLGGTKMFGTVADLGGGIQHEVYRPWQTTDPERNFEQVCDMIQELIQAPRPAGQEIRGIGVGAPGITNSEEGRVIWAPTLGWKDLPLHQMLKDRFGVAVIVENDVNLAALGEMGFGAGMGSSSLVCLAIGTGIGAGIVIDRKIYRGARQAAGEIGFLPPDLACLDHAYPDFGALESLASGTGIAEQARTYLRESGQTDLVEEIDAQMVFAEAAAGTLWAEQVIRETVDYLSMAVAAINVLLDPEVIVLGGGVSRSADVLIEPIQERLQGVIPSTARLVKSSLGYRAAAMGAIMLVLDTTTAHVAIQDAY